MVVIHTGKQKFAILFLTLIFAGITGLAQKPTRGEPEWWFGGSVAANFNFYRGTTQMLNNSLSVPTAFHKGHGVRPYVSVLAEYKPNKVWGGMLNIAYDNRGGKFNGVTAPCNCAADLSTNISYLAFEPSLKFSPFASSFYVFAGPTLSFNLSRKYTYKQQKQTDRKGNWSDIHKTTFSAQAGAGIDLPLSLSKGGTQMSYSPFISFQTDLGHEPRSVETWSFYTIRTGIAFKFRSVRKSPAATPTETVTIEERKVQFTV